ncbi:MAG: PEP-CTERM sorting domain-containing protein [Gemmatimonadaceae bacterium]|nr:PEP-CTERM sorting domain-containing protein [Gemmatimonadaceae bacterium]
MLSRHLGRNARRALGIFFIAGSSLQAQTYGNSLVARPNIDEFSGFLTILSTPFLPGSVGGTLSTFSVFGGLAATGGTGGTTLNRALAPILAREVDGLWTIVGVGTLRTVGDGLNTWDFGLTSGSAAIDADLRFGWWSSGLGAVHYALGGELAFFTDNQTVLSSPTAGQSYETPIDDQLRTYSIQWTVAPATTTVPEPSTYALMGAGLIAVGALRRRQRTTR